MWIARATNKMKAVDHKSTNAMNEPPKQYETLKVKMQRKR